MGVCVGWDFHFGGQCRDRDGRVKVEEGVVSEKKVYPY